MRPGIFYLPEYHDFSYVATVPWPHVANDYQQDWVNAIDTLEQWLDRTIGPHYAEWAWARQAETEYWQASIAFKRDRNRTLFLLAWS